VVKISRVLTIFIFIKISLEEESKPLTLSNHHHGLMCGSFDGPGKKTTKRTYKRVGTKIKLELDMLGRVLDSFCE